MLIKNIWYLLWYSSNISKRRVNRTCTLMLKTVSWLFQPQILSNHKNDLLFPFKSLNLIFNSSFQLIPESHRATVTNWFRVPMNIITCATMLAVNHPLVAADKRSILFIITNLFITFICYLFSIYYYYFFI